MKLSFSIKNIISFVAVLLIACATILFSVLYVNTFTNGFFYTNKKLILSIVTIIISVITVIATAYSFSKNKAIYKLALLTLGFITFALIILYVLTITGFLDKIDSIEDLRNYVASFGYYALLIYTVINILQVVILPIPGFISIGTGVALFGPTLAFIFSFIGITIGSIIAFLIGRYFGYKVVKWLIGEDTLKKWLIKIKNKDKIVLTFMFLFPFFPDDVLCFVSGLSTMSFPYFIITIVVCRLISSVLSAYSLNGSIIPYTTWWGILLWAIIILAVIWATLYLYKNGDDLIRKFRTLIKKRRKKLENNSSR